MPLNKLENFIKNYEGRILYVNPNDLDATDSITNQGNSLTKPFKTIQRALLESARFSFVPGENNDRNDITTILVYPGEHVIDNRPGYGIRKTGTALAEAVSPSGSVTSPASDIFTLNLQSNFDLTQEDNILYKFNSVNGGVILPRGTSLIGLDLRKTKIRPKYVPNPTDPGVPNSAIFRITGNCFFWQFSLFDADPNSLVYTDNKIFGIGTGNQATPTFSHHKLTCFEYADGVNTVQGFDLTDLDMYYAKLSNAYNEGSGRQIPAAQKFPLLPGGFSKVRSEWEIVGAFATDPVQITNIISGDGATPSSVISVTTLTPHGLTVDTPIKIKGVNVNDYNISTVVQSVTSPTSFTYLISSVRNDLPASPGGSATVTIETDTVKGASPYIFNCSLRSVWGMNGMHANGNTASGFRSMVVAQFTAVSLQKDDRAFVKYDPITRTYSGIQITKQVGSQLSTGSASKNSSTVYHLDSSAIYRVGWESSHIKFTNDAFIQIVSVFAIGFNKHFDGQSGGDASITNSNSNFGQFSLSSEGFKKTSFPKDNYGYITSIITPKSITSTEQNIDWISIDVEKTINVGISSHLYLYGFKTFDNVPPSLIQGYRIGAKKNDLLYLDLPNGSTVSDAILMTDNVITNSTPSIKGTDSSYKQYNVVSTSISPNYDSLYLNDYHNIQTGEKIIILSDTGDYPENIKPHITYYAIKPSLSTNQIKIASSYTNAINGVAIKIYGGTKLKILSRVSDKDSGQLGSVIQYDSNNSNWFVHVEPNGDIYNSIVNIGVNGFTEPRTDVTYVKRINDSRSLDEKLYKVRICIPKESPNARNPSEGFIIQESSKTGPVDNTDFTLTSINNDNFDYNRNPRFISTCSQSSGTVTVIAEKPHNLNVGDRILIKNVKSSTNLSGVGVTGYNGDFIVSSVSDDKTFSYSINDINGISHNVGIFSGPSTRDINLPRFERNDLQSNLYIYRLETINPYIFNVQDGIYHAYVLNASNAVSNHFTNYKYRQNVVNLYPELDRDNIDDNPSSTSTYAKVSPLGDVNTNNLKNSITRESLDKLVKSVGIGLTIVSVTPISSGISTITLERSHGFGGIVGYSSKSFGSGYTNGTYYNVRLLNNDTSWNGATATIIVSGGNITSFNISDGGSGYLSGQTLSVEGFSGSTITISNSCISKIDDCSIQITGIGTAPDGLYRVVNVPSKSQIAVAKTSGDPKFVLGQYSIVVGPSTFTSQTQYSQVTGTTTFTFNGNHGLVTGNKFRVVVNSISESNNLGDFIVKDVIGINTITAVTNLTLPSNVRVLKHGFNSNDLESSSGVENLGSRGISFFSGETAILSEDILSNTTGISTFAISIPNSGISTVTRFPLGSYIQIDGEIMRISSSTLSGSGNNQISAIRGYFGTSKETHFANSIIKKIKPIPIEIRRPSILRASGQTFEYLGYGPGNYSTGLPQIQIKSLTEREEFLSQSQERSGGFALYTGMNSNGDFFIGNTKYSATSGTQLTFNIPVPTVSGQDPSRLSVVFDEIVVKERILVEGGKSKQILSQFDGPVTFNQNIIVNNETTKINGQLISSNLVTLNNTTDSFAITNGSVVSKGGFGIAKNVNIGGNISVAGVSTFTGVVQFNTGIVPDTDKDSYIGKVDKSFTKAYIDEIQIGSSGNTINTRTGTLKLDAANKTVEVLNDLIVDRNTSATGLSTFNGVVQFNTGIVPDVDKQAYIGTNSKSFTSAYIDEIKIGVDANTINTRTNNLQLNSATEIVQVLKDIQVDRDAYISGIATIGSNTVIQNTLTVNGGGGGDAVIIRNGGDLRIYNNLNTGSGVLFCDNNNELRTGGTFYITNALNVNGQTYISGITTVATGILPNSDKTSYLGSSTKAFANAYVDEIKMGASGNTIDTRSGNLKLNAATNTVQVLNNLIIDGNSTATGTSSLVGNVNITTGITPVTDKSPNLGSNTKAFANAYVDEIKIGASGNTIDTRSGNLKLNAATSTVEVLNNLLVNGNSTTTGTSSLVGAITVTTGITPVTDKSPNLGSNTKAFANAYVDEIKIGASGNTIDTRSGNLKLNAATNTVQVLNNLIIDGNSTTTGTSTLTGNTTLTGTLTVNGGGGGDAVIIRNGGDLRIYNAGNTGSAVLYCDSNTILRTGNFVTDGYIQINQTLSVSGDTSFSANVSIQGASKSFAIKNSGGTTQFSVATDNGNVSTNGTLTVSQGTTLSSTLNVGSTASINSINDSSSTITGALTVAGGLGVAKKLYVGGDSTFPNVYTSGGGSVGTNANPWSSVYATTFYGTTFTGNSATASTATNVVGTGGRVLYNNTTNTTTTSSNLSFDGTNLSVGGDITAFASDIRLKTNVIPISDALNKTLKLNGFTYTFNEIGQSFGFDSNTRHSGVSAQEVQSVLPEATALAPVDNNYLTVKYEKIVPLLIEAIKELADKVENLQQKLLDK